MPAARSAHYSWVRSFNNLLHAIRGYTNFARKALPANEQPHQDLEQALKAVDQAATLTRQLLGFGRRQDLEFADIELNQLVDEFLAMLRPLIGPQISFILNLPHSLASIHADPGQLQQVLMNLCLNARDAMPDGGNVIIGTERRNIAADAVPNQLDLRPGNYQVLSVRDTGSGMSPDVKEHIFEPFYTTKEVGKGTGLGLAMVYGIVQQHQGGVCVFSERGVGTTFEIHLPESTDHDL